MAGRPKGTTLNGRPRYLSDDELARFMAAARRHGKKWDCLWSLVYFFAMRIGEAVSFLISVAAALCFKAYMSTGS